MELKQGEILIKVWNKEKKEMSAGMSIPMLAGFVYAQYPHLQNLVYLRWSGLEDRLGVKMYEGDILQHVIETPHGYHNVLGVMYFNYQKAQFGVEIDIETGEQIGNHFEVKESISGRPIVIGNIFETPTKIK